MTDAQLLAKMQRLFEVNEKIRPLKKEKEKLSAELKRYMESKDLATLQFEDSNLQCTYYDGTRSSFDKELLQERLGDEYDNYVLITDTKTFKLIELKE